MPSNMFMNSSNYIRYSIEAVLPNFDDLSNAQAFKLNFHVREPPRSITGPIKGEGAG